MASATVVRAADAPALPDDAAYVHVNSQGHLELANQRVRYWGFIGFISSAADINASDSEAQKQAKIAKKRADIDLTVQRIDDLGFNLIRSWEGTFDHDAAGLPTLLSNHDYTPGDGSVADAIAYYFWKLDQRGIKIWMSSFTELGPVTPHDADIVDDPATKKTWCDAVLQLMKTSSDLPALRCTQGSIPGLCRYFDPRFEKLVFERYKMGLDFPNKYKGGLRLADDPQVVVWELTNEEIAYRGFFNGGWQDLPSFFRNELLAKWQDYLKRKYGSDDKLKTAWRFLLPGESLADGSVLLAPIASPVRADAGVNDTNPAVLASLHVLKQTFSRDDFTRSRGEDVVEFFTELMAAHKQRFSQFVKAQGKSCRLSPVVWDSGNCYQIQSSYLHQQSDATSVCTYTKGMGFDPHARRFPFYSALDNYPRLCWDTPWLEASSSLKHPTFVYETQIDCRTKYRAEYPLMMAATGALQDLDIVCWHAYGHGHDSSDPHTFDRPIGIWQDYFEYDGDEVQLSVMKAAGEAFKHSLLSAPTNPTIFTFGRHSLYDPASMDYGRSFGDLGNRIIPTLFNRGVRVQVDATQADDTIKGVSMRPDVYPTNPLRPTDEVTFDWQKSYLKLDAPGVAGFVGFATDPGSPALTCNQSHVQFADITVKNPPGMPYPVRDDERYVALTLASMDGKPLASCDRAVLSMVSTSFNSGYKLDVKEGSHGQQGEGPDPNGPTEFWGSFAASPGGLPVLVARVGATVKSPAIDGMHYVVRDWHMKAIREGRVENGTFRLSSDVPAFVIEFERK